MSSFSGLGAVVVGCNAQWEAVACSKERWEARRERETQDRAALQIVPVRNSTRSCRTQTTTPRAVKQPPGPQVSSGSLSSDNPYRDPRNSFTPAAFLAPTNLPICFPSLNAITVGSAAILYSPARALKASVSIVTRSTVE